MRVFCLSMALLSYSIMASAAGFAGVEVGSRSSQLPSCMSMTTYLYSDLLPYQTAEGQCGSAWVIAKVRKDIIESFEVVYVGQSVRIDKTSDKQLTFNKSMSLGEAINLHSMQLGFANPAFGYLKDHHVLVDFSNAIEYAVPSVNLDAPVSVVTYLQPSALDVVFAKQQPLGEHEVRALFSAESTNARRIDASRACPVAIEGVYVHGDTLTVNVYTKNISDKTIVGIRFSLYYVDSVGEFHDLNGEYNAGATIKPGQKRLAEVRYYLPEYRNTHANTEKVRFEDGSTWQNDGTMLCSK